MRKHKRTEKTVVDNIITRYQKLLNSFVLSPTYKLFSTKKSLIGIKTMFLIEAIKKSDVNLWRANGVVGEYDAINELYPVTNESSVEFHSNVAIIKYNHNVNPDNNKRFDNILSDTGMRKLLNYIHGYNFLGGF